MEQRIVTVAIQMNEIIPGTFCIFEFTQNLRAIMEVLSEHHPLTPRSLILVPPAGTREIGISLLMNEAGDRPLDVSALNRHVHACVEYLADQYFLEPVVALITANRASGQAEQ